MRGVGVVADGGADAGKLVGGNRDAGPAAAHDDAAIGVAVAQRVGDGLSRVGVVDRRRGVGAEVEDGVPLLPQDCGQIPLHFVAGVVGAEGQAHRARLLYFSPMRNTSETPPQTHDHAGSVSLPAARCARRLAAVAALALLVTSGSG